MTEKDDLTTNNTSESADNPNINTDDLDIEGALAALSSLRELSGEQEVEEYIEEPETEIELDIDDANEEKTSDIEPFERIDDDADIDDDVLAIADEPEPDISSAGRAEVTIFETAFPHPPVSTLHRGQLASVVPALLLIGIGGYLTFIVTTSESPLQLPVIATIAVVGLGAMLLAQWLSTSRWSIGSFFIGVLMLLTGGTVAYLVLPNQLSLVDGYPLIATATGTAFVITDVFVPSGRRIWLIGLILAIAGLAGVFVTTTLVNLPLVASLSGLLPVALVILAVLIIAPFVSRRQQS